MLVTNLAILVLAGFVGFAVISKVPNTLHTPLMSGTNAIHGIVVLGGILVIGFAANDLLNKVLLVIAIAFGTINVVGGFLVTDRMLGMFKRKPEPRPQAQTPEPKPPAEATTAPAPDVDSSEQDRGSAATSPAEAAGAAPEPSAGAAESEPGAAPEPSAGAAESESGADA